MAITKQAYEYSPSVNIKRDIGKNLRYIPTYNGQRAFEQIVEAAALGTRTFTIIGAYGSGKSTFLWALAETAAGRKTCFDRFNYLLKGYAKNQLLDLVGEFTSLQAALAGELKCKEDEVIASLTVYAEKLQKKQTALIIRIDEYGKFLEYAAKNNPHSEIYFLQQLAELANNAKRNILLITTLHQDFGGYAFSLTERERKEWTKVQGRFKEITFNEPAEQLLRIAANRLEEIDYDVKTPTVKKLLQIIEKAKAFPLRDYFTPEIAQQLAPIELLAGSALTIGLQRYGQNERSFFSFIEAQDYYGLHHYLKAPDAPFYYLPHVYDYLIYHYYSQLTAQHNPDHRAWRLMRDKLEAAESQLDESLHAAYAVIKTIGLLNLLGISGATINDKFLIGYLKLAGNIDEKQTKEAIRLLVQHKHIRYRNHSNRYVLFEGTDVDIDLAIDEAGRVVEQVTNISQYLNGYFTFPVIPAKRYQIEVGTPRFFDVRLSDELIIDVPYSDQDGFINLVFSSKHSVEDVTLYSKQARKPILYVLFKQIQQIKEQVLNIEKVRIAKADHHGDIVAAREFEDILSHYKNLLRYFVMDKFNMASPEDVIFIFNGEVVNEIYNRRTLNNFLSKIAENAYPSTPHYLNEMVNKTKLSAAISTARKNLVKNLIDNGDQEDIGYPTHLFPPDKMIYLSLLKDKGFHRQENNGQWILGAPLDASFDPVWGCYEDFLHTATQSKRSLQDLVNQLLKPPYKLKRGLVDILLPIFLLIKKDELSLYHQSNDRFIPDLSTDTLDLVVRKPSDYSIKTFSVEGIRLSVFNQYRELLSQTEAEKLSTQGFVDTIIPFLSFYRGLPEYAKRTKKITKEAQRLRETILKATDPEKSFFEDFPQALGYALTELHEDSGKLQAYFNLLRSCIKEIQFSYDALLDRYEQFILEEIISSGTEHDFETWRAQLQQRFASVKSYIIAPYLKTFLQRINAPLDDKRAWLSAVAQVVLGKSIEQIQDDEEPLLYVRFSDWVHELDNYTDIAQATQGTGIEEALRVEVTNLQSGKQMKIVKVPEGKTKQINSVEKLIGSALTDDKNLNIFILSKMLNELLK
ncbi:hypothetical protein [Parapedobacter koreensis]|uniref:Uncharacterized protein n=1 Tax=Parapedobacter koreensis TaxID=332977 RepID=A0A1H7PZZ4_9SPHI|nr:hypothetical protein [Parapedobacter koreensis]SEL41332.1 hypothetical protein SAMN05421740_105102 [Parapedobacter koreensis]